ncbi:coatomer WD associated region-domain-containing protein [Mycena olivaceomarginata]|nr:coatomer WD associated region-domain-containing protein [Mycena olivaceomarginata]
MSRPTLPLIISAARDRTITIWRMSETKAWEVDSCRGHFNNVSTVLFHPKHELIVSCGEDKTICVLASHPNLNLFPPGHDSGLIVFKLKHERPAFAVCQDSLYYIRDNACIPPRMLSFNPAERAVLVTSSSDNGLYEFTALLQQAQGELKDSRVDSKKGAGQSAIFMARNKFAVIKTIKPPVQTNEIFHRGTASLILSSTSSVVFYDIRQQKTLAESNDGSLVALMSKYTITIANKNSQHSLIHETIRIKSGAWDDSGVFIYSTLNHVKYLPFKLALLKNNYEEMLYIICTSALLGQNIIAYLQQKGFPENTQRVLAPAFRGLKAPHVHPSMVIHSLWAAPAPVPCYRLPNWLLPPLPLQPPHRLLSPSALSTSSTTSLALEPQLLNMFLGGGRQVTMNNRCGNVPDFETPDDEEDLGKAIVHDRGPAPAHAGRGGLAITAAAVAVVSQAIPHPRAVGGPIPDSDGEVDESIESPVRPTTRRGPGHPVRLIVDSDDEAPSAQPVEDGRRAKDVRLQLEANLKSLKVADLRFILTTAHQPPAQKTKKDDLIATILASETAINVYRSNFPA